MAIMIPSVISPEVKSSAERKIFEWFQNAPGTDKWIVLHSLGIATHNKVIYPKKNGPPPYLLKQTGMIGFALLYFVYNAHRTDTNYLDFVSVRLVN